MKKIWMIFLSVLMLFVLLFVGSNMFFNNRQIEVDKSYRVELNRVLNNLEGFDATNYKYIYDVRYSDNVDELLDTTDSYYIAKKDNGYCQIFYKNEYKDDKPRVIVNIILGVALLIVILVFAFIITRIIRPFLRFSELPQELSKGNLTVPLKENKNRYFGRFLWGMDLLREKLEDDKRKELELIKEKKLLLLSLSHDIKTPLSAIKLYSKALSKNLYDDESKKKLISQNIDEKVSEIEKFISDIVKASNEDFLEFEVNNSEIYIGEVFSKIDEYYKEKMTLSGIDFSIENNSNCLVVGDFDRVVEVIQNVIENAVKYGDGGFIKIKTEREDDEFCISIINSGCKLQRSELIHIFDSFFRGSNSKKQSGSGLGLFICRKLVQMMQGEILADIQDQNMIINIVLKVA